MKYLIKIKGYERDAEGNPIETVPNIEDSEFGKVMTELFKIGFVFTCERRKSLNDIKNRFEKWWIWDSIIIGESLDCKMLVDAGRNYAIYCSLEENWMIGTFDELIEKIRRE